MLSTSKRWKRLSLPLKILIIVHGLAACFADADICDAVVPVMPLIGDAAVTNRGATFCSHNVPSPG